jgi:hypothetical protein
VVHGRVGAGIKGVQPPLCVTRVRGSSAAAHAEDQQIAGVFNMFVGDQDLAPQKDTVRLSVRLCCLFCVFLVMVYYTNICVQAGHVFVVSLSLKTISLSQSSQSERVRYFQVLQAFKPRSILRVPSLFLSFSFKNDS